MLELNPYHSQAGHELDVLIHLHVMKDENSSDSCPAYSSEMSQAKKVLARLKSFYRTSVISGRTSLAGRAWFARVKTRSKHGTEVLAETLPLAICRLALLEIVNAEPRRPT